MRPAGRDLSRFKYYNAIKTGFKHMEENEGTSLLDQSEMTGLGQSQDAPTHVVDDECFVIPLPLMLREAGQLQNSYVMVLSICHTMIGTAVVCLPWAFQQSGVVLGVIICFSSYMVSFYTTKLIVDTTGKDADFCITTKRYFGKYSSFEITDNFNLQVTVDITSESLHRR